MATALLTGSKHRTSRLSATLRSHEADIVVADSWDGMIALTSRLPERSIGGYVQLLMNDDAAPSWVPPITERLEAMALVAPLLVPDAAVVLVADESADPAHDQRVADGLRLVAEGALSDSDHVGLRVSVLQAASADEITSALRRPDRAQGWPGPLADLGAERDYADWRTDILNLTSTPDATYFGWVNQEGCPRVGILRGSVLSPLEVPPESPYAWGTGEPGSLALGRALITASLGGQSVDDDVVELFVKDVIGSLSPTGFELAASEVERWIRATLGASRP
jgi:hypothetical protein